MSKLASEKDDCINALIASKNSLYKRLGEKIKREIELIKEIDKINESKKKNDEGMRILADLKDKLSNRINQLLMIEKRLVKDVAEKNDRINQMARELGRNEELRKKNEETYERWLDEQIVERKKGVQQMAVEIDKLTAQNAALTIESRKTENKLKKQHEMQIVQIKKENEDRVNELLAQVEAIRRPFSELGNNKAAKVNAKKITREQLGPQTRAKAKRAYDQNTNQTVSLSKKVKAETPTEDNSIAVQTK